MDVIHISQFLNELIHEGKLNFKKSDFNVTYHDSCHLGRHMEVFDEPRSVIENVAGIVEMENSREETVRKDTSRRVHSSFKELSASAISRRELPLLNGYQFRMDSVCFI